MEFGIKIWKRTLRGKMRPVCSTKYVGTKPLGKAIVLCHHSVSFTIDGSDDLLRPYWIELTCVSHQPSACSHQKDSS